MHLLQAGVPLITIKDFLGHVDVKSTEVYIQIDLTMKREALTLVGSPARPAAKDKRLPNDLLVWLESL
jgi:integrase/recombinase XerD